MTTKPEKSVLLLACTDEKRDSLNNTWFNLSPTGNLSVISTSQLSEFGYNHTAAVVVGSYLYIIGGFTRPPYRIISNTIMRTNLANPPYNNWEECFRLPFYCHTNKVAVCGKLIYIFEGNFSLDSKHIRKLKVDDWAYVYDTAKCNGWFIPQPRSSSFQSGSNKRVMVSFCGTINWIGEKVVVYIGEKVYIHDPFQQIWRPYSDFNHLYHDPIFRRDESLIASVVVNDGIFYYMHYDWRYFDFDNNSRSSTCEMKPTLTAYDIKKGNHRFQLEVDSVGLGLAGSSSSHLVAIGDLELCWINTHSADEGFFVTKIGIRYDPKPKLVILKRRRFHTGIRSFACCLSIDFSSEESSSNSSGSMIRGLPSSETELGLGIILKDD